MKLSIKERATSSITPYDQNPRKNDAAVLAVAKSIEEFGFRQPIVVDEEDVVIVGHTRLKAAQHLGLEKVPVHVATDLTDAQKKAYRIADNQTPAIAEWDVDLLPVELQELEALDFDLSLLGFSDADLARYMNSGGTVGETDPDDVPEPPDDPVTKKGDLWVLGPHRLLCGDSASTSDLDRLLDGAPIHLVNTDPPYNVKVEPRSNNAIAAGLSSFSNDAAHKKHHQKFDLKRHPEKSKGTSKKMRAKDRPLENDFVTDEAFTALLSAWFGNLARVQSMVHLTEKPVELAVRAMEHSSQPGENVLDLFGGSGSTLIGAEQSGRRAFLMEIDQAYCDVIVQRWEAFTGKKATRMEGGE